MDFHRVKPQGSKKDTFSLSLNSYSYLGQTNLYTERTKEEFWTCLCQESNLWCLEFVPIKDTETRIDRNRIFYIHVLINRYPILFYFFDRSFFFFSIAFFFLFQCHSLIHSGLDQLCFTIVWWDTTTDPNALYINVISNIGSLTGSLLLALIKLLSVGYETLVSSLFYYLYFSLSAHPSNHIVRSFNLWLYRLLYVW